MSVPLDRLYNFLHDVCNHRDLLIYRFFPHGSRKIIDLTQIYSLDDRLVDSLISDKTIVFFHDQEPLNFDFYSSIDIDQRRDRYQLMDDDLFQKHKALGEKIMPEMNLRWAVGMYIWRLPVLLVHSEKRSTELERYKNIQFTGVYWWCHGIIARDWFRYAEFDRQLDIRLPKQTFLIYNRAWTGTREYRVKFAELLLRHNLKNHCLTWFNACDDGYHYSNYDFKNPLLKPRSPNIEEFFNQSQATSGYSADYNVQDYQGTEIEVVLETLFDDGRLHLTEKSLRPIACGHPFILAATHGSLKYLRDYGFETFSPWIDETYDTIENPAQRLEAIVQEMKRIANLSADEKMSMYAELKNIAIRNKKLFFSDAWQKSIVDEYKTNFDQAITQLTQF
jgi:hypothetical protein